jgi:OFA family oxalate/formate antiporter-like MFS transporter
MRSDFPFRPASLPFYYGWVVLVISTVGVVMSVPGQTMGISVFTDSLLDVTGLTRLQLSNAYLVGTVASGLMLPIGGRLVDEFGTRRGVIFACVGLAVMLVYLSNVDRVAASLTARFHAPAALTAWLLLAVGFTGIRFTGQGMLTLCSRTMLGRWFEKRRGLVSSLSGPFVSFAFAGAPLLLATWVDRVGWREAWVQMAFVVALGMGGLGWLLFRETPEDCGLQIDGGAAEDVDERAAKERTTRDYTRGEALRTAAFWIVTLGIANHAMVGTGLTFHIVDLGAEAGLDRAAAVAIFLPIAIVSIPTGIAIGAAVDRYPMKFLIMAMVVGQMVMFALAGHLDDPVLRIVCIAGWGFSSGFYGPITVAALPNFFGRTHLGSIQGAFMMILVISSALGPSALALAKDAFGSYAPGLYALTLLPLAVFVAAPFTRDPGTLPREG